MPSSGHHELTSGRSLGRYRVLDTLGAGGMGEVYSAGDMSLERRVAIKILIGRNSAVAGRPIYYFSNPANDTVPYSLTQFNTAAHCPRRRIRYSVGDRPDAADKRNRHFARRAMDRLRQV